MFHSIWGYATVVGPAYSSVSPSLERQMSLAPIIVSAVQAHANSSALGGISGEVLVYLGSLALFGLIGLIPFLASKPPVESPPPQWTVVDAANRQAAPVGGSITKSAQTIDGEVTAVHEPPKLVSADRRWGR